MLLLIVHWAAVHPTLGWTLIGLLCAAILLGKVAPAERRRTRFVLALWLLALALWLIAALLPAPLWVWEATLAIEQVMGLHLAVILLFFVILKRLRTPGIVVDLTVVAGYIAILIALLTRVGVNLTGIIATSAVVTAVIGFSLQDLLANLAGGLALQIEQAITEGDWIRTDQYMGQVRNVRVRYTTLETPDGDTVLVPNSAVTRSPVTVLGRSRLTADGPIKHRKLITFQLPYDGHSPTSIVNAVDRALAASPIEGIAEVPQPRCVIVDFHPQHVQYGALVWMMRPGMENVDSSRVRIRISSALGRAGAGLASISHVVDLRGASPHSEDDDSGARLTALRGVEILASLNEEEARELASRMRKESFAPDEMVLRQGDEGDSLYILRRGRVRILITGGSGLSEQVACLAPGDFFGEMSLLTGEKRTATALAIDEVECYCLEKEDLSALLRERPGLAGDISNVLAARQTGLAAAHERLDEESEKQRGMNSHHDLLTRIKTYFAMR